MPRFQVVPPCGGHPPVIGAVLAVRLFQVVPPCGGHRGVSCKKEILLSKFQVVPPCGGHQLRDSNRPKMPSFKSCPRVGGILGGDCMSVSLIVSSRAPVWGASEFTDSGSRITDGFQVVPPCGGHRAGCRIG